MYFSKVELHNYGIYKGTHEMSLLNKLGNRNITLIGGLNGRGKTTFHDGVLIALYGKQSLKYIQEKARSYEKLLSNRMNKQATDDETYVAVSLILDDETELQVKRRWWKRNNRIAEEVVVEKNGVVDKYLGESWSYYIEEILPFGIARFFFFNNEKITQLADDTSFEQIKSSIKSAIGVSTIERAIDHADEVIRRKKNAIKAFETSELNQAYQEVEKELADNSKKLTEANELAGELELKCQDYAIQLEVKENEFWSSGGDLSKNRNAIKAEMEKIKESVRVVQQEIQLMVSDAATPLALCRELVKQSYDSEKKYQSTETQNYVNTIIDASYRRIMEQLRDADIAVDVLQKIQSIFNAELQRHRPKDETTDRVNIAPSSMMLYEHLIADVFGSINERISALIRNAEAQEAEYMSLDAHLGAADEKTMAMQLFEALKSIEQDKAVADSEYAKKLEAIESLKRQREQLMSRRVQLIKGLAEKENSNDDNVRIIQYAAMSIEMLTEFKNRLQREKVKKLSSTVTGCFKTLVEKESLVGRIDINPQTLDVRIIDMDENELLKEQLSAGEQQMFAVSIVWALALTSGYKAPVIIDTPMARLDSSHRMNFVTKYLPAASTQVLVLSTDEEIYGRYTVDYVSPDESGRINPAQILQLVNEKTLLVSVMHVNSETGIIQPVDELGEELAQRGVFFHIDATQSFGKLNSVIRKTKYNMLSITAHKVGGPQGVGAFVLKRGKDYRRPPVAPILFGGQQERGYRPGTTPVALVAGFSLAAQLCEGNIDEYYQKCIKLKKSFFDAISGLKYEINGDQHFCLPSTINISFTGVDAEGVFLATKNDYAFSNGSACNSNSHTPSYVLTAMGLSEQRISEALRISWGPETTVNFGRLVQYIKSMA